MKFLEKLWNALVGVFDAAKKAYNKLTPEQQQALLNGSGIIEIINENLEKTPEQIRELIRQKFPDIDEKKLEEAIFRICGVFNITWISFDDAILGVIAHLHKLEGAEWAAASHIGASIIALVFAPAPTKFATIVSLIEYVYQKFFKKAL